MVVVVLVEVDVVVDDVDVGDVVVVDVDDVVVVVDVDVAALDGLSAALVSADPSPEGPVPHADRMITSITAALFTARVCHERSRDDYKVDWLSLCAWMFPRSRKPGTLGSPGTSRTRLLSAS